MPPASFSSPRPQDSMDSLSHSYSLMRLQKEDQPHNPRDGLMDLIQQVEHDHLQQALHMELKRLLNSQDQLVIALQQRARKLEQENDTLKAQTAEYQRRYDKAVREMQFFRKKYDRAIEQAKVPSSNSSTTSSGHRVPVDTDAAPAADPTSPTSPLPPTPSYSHTSADDGRYRPGALMPTRSVSASTSSSSHTWGPAQPLPAVPSNVEAMAMSRNAPPPSSIYSMSTDSSFSDSRSPHLRHNPSIHSTFSNAPSTIYSASTAPSMTSGGPTSVYSAHSAPTRSNTTASTNDYTSNSLIQQRRVDPLVFGGSEGLWDTIAKARGNDPTVEKTISNFLRRGGSPNTAKQTPSHGAVKYGYGMIHALIVTKASSAFELLLQQGANPNAMSLSTAEEDKVAPCYVAASIGWLPGLQKLVQAGADLVHARGPSDKTVLHVAAEHCHASVVEYMVNCTQGALNQQVDKNGATVLHYAAQSGHTDLVSFLARTCQVPVSKADHKGELPIHWAARAGRLEVVTVLVERFGCDINAYVSKKVPTPLDLAKNGNHKRLIDYLKGAGALSAKKMDKKRDEELNRKVPRHLESTLAKNGLLGFGGDDGFF